MRTRGSAIVATVALAGAACAWLACSDDVRSHIFAGRQYDPTRNCLLDLQAIDVVEGPTPQNTCPPACVVSDETDAEPSLLYVSTMCPPYPIYPYESDAGSDPRCAEALLANVYNTSCEADGAIYNLPPEAGPDAGDAGVDGAADATVEAGADAAVDAGGDAVADGTPTDG